MLDGRDENKRIKYQLEAFDCDLLEGENLQRQQRFRLTAVGRLYVHLEVPWVFCEVFLHDRGSELGAEMCATVASGRIRRDVAF